MEGFFNLTESNAPRPSALSLCGQCGLHRTCKSPKMEPTGDGGRGVLIVAEAPGANEDARGIQLIGDAGKLLRKELAAIGIDLEKDCWKTNAVICRPPKNKTPDSAKIEACRPNLIKTIQRLNPRVIIPLGAVAVESILGLAWRGSIDGLGRWAGFQIPLQLERPTWVCPTFHPSFILRDKDEATTFWWRRHLKAAFGLKGRPARLPDLAAQIQIIETESEAVDLLREYRDWVGTMAFDYETDRLKPDAHDSEIVSCSICFDGNLTVAFPMTPRVASHLTPLLTSPQIQKIASNMKFEERWTRAKLGVPVRNWFWDTMLAAHLLDHRPGITSIKFQAFVRMGLESYDEAIKPFFKTGPTGASQIRKFPLRDLLIYNGIDSLAEYKVAMLQRQEFFQCAQ